MGLFGDFGSNIFQVIGNPVGYVIERESVEKAARSYANKNQPLSGVDVSKIDTQTFEELKVNWVNGCAEKLKSDDVAKNRAKCIRNCEQAFNDNPTVKKLYIQMAELRAIEKEKTKKKIALYGGIGLIVLFVLIILIYAMK